jgi:hypothetical protein
LSNLLRSLGCCSHKGSKLPQNQDMSLSFSLSTRVDKYVLSFFAFILVIILQDLLDPKLTVVLLEPSCNMASTRPTLLQDIITNRVEPAMNLFKNEIQSLKLTRNNNPADRTCMICWECLDKETAPMRCGRYWCTPCIVQAFTSVRNQSQWPVRCSSNLISRCNISFETTKPFLSDPEIPQFWSVLIAQMLDAVCSSLAKRPKIVSHTIKPVRPIHVQTAKEQPTWSTPVRCQINATKNFLSYHIK